MEHILKLINSEQVPALSTISGILINKDDVGGHVKQSVSVDPLVSVRIPDAAGLPTHADDSYP